jgi:potassium-transporting ATPase KdpC subunit
MLTEILASLRVAGLTIVVCAIGYPIGILAVSSVVAPEGRLGSLVVDSEGVIRGSHLIAQGFNRPEYFWPRPSACNYDASAAAGSNLSPTNPALRERAENLLDRLALPDDQAVPADLVTASGGGLDPHITYESAILQIARVARARGMNHNDLVSLIDRHTQQIPFTQDAASRLVHVLELNLALDQAATSANENE